MSIVNQSGLLRIAMWSGPRNISTAMMRSWGNRSDTVVVDEPLYAYYLKATGKDHPMAQEVIATGETDWRKVVADLTTDVPESGHKGPSHIFYQKHMTHHLLPEMGRDWLAGLTNCFLIRDPAEVIASYMKKNENPELEDLGFVRQSEIFEWVRETIGEDAAGDRCAGCFAESRTLPCGYSVGPSGSSSIRPCFPGRPGCERRDGVWAKHWYGEVAKSTGFEPYRARSTDVPERLRDIEARCRECYEQLYEFRLR